MHRLGSRLTDIMLNAILRLGRTDILHFITRLKGLGLTVKQFAEMTGVHYTTVNNWDRILPDQSLELAPKWVFLLLTAWTRDPSLIRAQPIVDPVQSNIFSMQKMPSLGECKVTSIAEFLPKKKSKTKIWVDPTTIKQRPKDDSSGGRSKPSSDFEEVTASFVKIRGGGKLKSK